MVPRRLIAAVARPGYQRSPNASSFQELARRRLW
jgi:hypothetical protein